jgi:hypothetical protein
LDRYAAGCVSFVLVVTRIVVQGAQSAPKDTVRQPRGVARVSRGRAPWLLAAFIITALAPVFPQQPGPQDRISFRIIVVETAEAAGQVLQRLTSGENFVAMAQKISVDPSASNGGLVGPVSLSDLRTELRSALEGLPADRLSGVVPLPTGFAVLKIVPAVEASAAALVTPSRLADAPMGSFTSALSATGSVKYVFDVSGYIDTTVSLRQYTPSEKDQRDFLTLCQVRRKIVTTAQTLVQKVLSSASARDSIAPIDRAQTHFLEGQLHAFQGNMAPAVEAFEKARQVAAAEVPSMRLGMEEALGVAYLHKAEMENGVYHEPGQRCLLAEHVQPFARTADVVKAIDHFSRYLAEKPDELEVRWLLNLAHMFAGTYPDKVPGPHLIPRSAFTSTEDAGRFIDVAAQAGLTSFAAAGGVIVDDFDGDSRLDVVTSSLDACEPLHFFRRNEQGGFTEQALAAGLGGQLGGLNIVQTDYNNDGHLDILVLRGAWEMAQRKSLLRNNGNGTFTDVTDASGLGKVLTRTQAAAWSDIDNDGHLDLFVGNEDGPAELFHNKRDGTFEDIAQKAGVARGGFNKGVAATDYDNDGWPDLYVSNLGGSNFLYRNNHDGTFTEFGRGAGVPGPGLGFPTWFFDYDNDGHQDLFVASYVTSVDEVARAHLRLPRNGNTLKLYRNLRDGSFQDVTRQVGLNKALMVMGANFGDIDNDGFLDMYLGTGNPSYAALVPSVLLRNKGGTSFVDVTGSSGTGELHKGHGVAFADLDDDGDEEIVFEVGGATPGDAHALRLFENPGHGGDWITLKLVGTRTNRAAIGARITVTVQSPAGKRSIHRVVGSGGSFGASPLRQHIGLGPAAQSVDVEIWWPASDTRQRFVNVGKNQTLEITELAREYTQLRRVPQRLGGGKP